MRFAMRSVLLVVALLLASATFAQAGDPPGKSDTLKWAETHNSYVGTNSCKMCHKFQYDSWAKTKHANAWAALKPEEQAKPECAECHMVGKTKSDSAIVDVGCEACHGPGSAYKNMKTMKDPALASAAGLLPVTEATCVRCHNARSPQFKGFDYAKALAAGIHEHKPKAQAK
ncbi:MAG TPA: multiheme c-type cytochrome [bacterium]|nr:multiheme c-type cytochrome [bacterium]